VPVPEVDRPRLIVILSDHVGDAVRIEPIERRKVYELVAERLAAQIQTSLEAGDPMPAERELAERYAVGRSSVREALRMLESRGLIGSRGNGTFVVEPRRNPFHQSLSLVAAREDVDAAQLFEVRRMIEAEAAALAAGRRTPRELQALHDATDAMEQALERVDAYLAADIRFHAAVAEATRNRLIRHLMEGIRERLEEMFGAVYRYPVGPERSVAQHRRIAEAIGNRDATLARSLMIEHIERVEHELAALQA
jgi:GntR family transcriptional repressor for pyruvate dehydrogenase complex